MSLLTRTSPFPSPNDTVFNNISPKMSATTTTTVYKLSGRARSKDAFLMQYIKSPGIAPSLPGASASSPSASGSSPPSLSHQHQLYFNSINKQRKIQLYDLYLQYLKNNNTPSASTSSYRFIRKAHVDILPTVADVRPSTPKVSRSPVLSYRSPVPAPSPNNKKHLLPVSEPAAKLQPQHRLVKKHLPQEFMDCAIDDLINLITRMLLSLIALNDKSVPLSISQPSDSSAASNNTLLTRYHSRTPPSISTHTYLARLTKFNNFNSATLLTTIYYIDLLSHQYQPFFTLNSWTVHRFLLVATMLAQKAMEDFFYTNDHYAKVGGVAILELNCLELDFLERVDWRCIPGKQLPETQHSSIRYAKDVLDLYYSQLIELMGKNNTLSGDLIIHYLPTGSEPVPTYSEESPPEYSASACSLKYSDDSDFDSGDDDDDDDVVMDKNGGPHGSYSPHFKRRRYSNN